MAEAVALIHLIQIKTGPARRAYFCSIGMPQCRDLEAGNTRNAGVENE